MGTKQEPGKYDCLDRAESDEPYFTLIGRDPWAPEMVELWAKVRYRAGTIDFDQYTEAMTVAEEMRQWRTRCR